MVLKVNCTFDGTTVGTSAGTEACSSGLPSPAIWGEN